MATSNSNGIMPTIFCTFGMFIIDEIEWRIPDPPSPKHNLIGGAGTYATLGARLVAGGEYARSVSWIVDVGSDFPSSVRKEINSWQTDCVFRYDNSRKTTRAWNGYGTDGWRDFKYLTPKIRLDVDSLNDAQTLAESFHTVCSAERCVSLVSNLNQRRSQLHNFGASKGPQRPVIVWEPFPDLCTPEHLTKSQQAATSCTIMSTNHDELPLFFPDGSSLSQAELVFRFMGWGKYVSTDLKNMPCIPVIREGANGSTAYFPPHFIFKKELHNDTIILRPSNMISLHLQAYHTESEAHQVMDPTGGGNTYLGALAVGLTDTFSGPVTEHVTTKLIRKALQLELSSPATLQHAVGTLTHGKSQASARSITDQQGCSRSIAFSQDDEDSPTAGKTVVERIVTAMIQANIAASFAIEQNGAPILTPGGSEPTSETSEETWNGETFIVRLQKYLDREGDGIRAQLKKFNAT